MFDVMNRLLLVKPMLYANKPLNLVINYFPPMKKKNKSNRMISSPFQQSSMVQALLSVVRPFPRSLIITNLTLIHSLFLVPKYWKVSVLIW